MMMMTDGWDDDFHDGVFAFGWCPVFSLMAGFDRIGFWVLGFRFSFSIMMFWITITVVTQSS